MAVLMATNESTEALVTQARAGDRVAYGRLAERFIEPLRRRVRSRMGAKLRGELDVDDVVQETFRQGLEGIERFAWRGEGSFLRWLGTIAENVIRRRAREQSRRPPAEPFEQCGWDPTPDADPDHPLGCESCPVCGAGP